MAIGDALGFGTSSVHIDNGTLLATHNETLANDLLVQGPAPTIAAAHGKTLTLTPDFWEVFSLGPLVKVTFGGPGNDGTVVWNTGAGGYMTYDDFAVDVVAGTLRDGDGSLTFLTRNAAFVKVEAGATLDFDHYVGTVADLEGGGTVTGTGILEIDGGNFAGKIGGNLFVDVLANTVLTGNSTFTDGTRIESGAALALGNGGTSGSIPGAMRTTDRSSPIAATRLRWRARFPAPAISNCSAPAPPCSRTRTPIPAARSSLRARCRSIPWPSSGRAACRFAAAAFAPRPT